MQPASQFMFTLLLRKSRERRRRRGRRVLTGEKERARRG